MKFGRLNPKTLAPFRGPRCLLLVLPVLALTLSACDWPQFGLYNHGTRDSADTGISFSNVASTTVDWTATTGGAVTSSPAVVNGVVYVGSDDDKVYALNTTTGATLWTVATGGEVESSPTVVNGVVYVGSDDTKVYTLNATTGATLWMAKTSGQVRSSPVVDGSVVYVGSISDGFYALNAATGATLWFDSRAAPAVFYGPATVGNGIVYVQTLNFSPMTHAFGGSVYAFDASTGATIWSASNLGGVSLPSLANGALYVGSVSGSLGSASGSLVALDATTGATLWTTATGVSDGTPAPSPAVSHGVVYISDGADNVNALNATTGATLWTSASTGGFSSAAVANGIVYVGGGVDNVYALNATTGATLWTGTTSAAVYSSPAVSNGVIYVGSNDNKVYAFKP